MNNVIILGVSADIGQNLCKFFLDDGADVIGTYRNDFPQRAELESIEGLTLVQCDLTEPADIDELVKVIKARNFHWTTLFSSVGTSEPIGRFFELDFDDWERSVDVNMLSQLRAIHALYPSREKSVVVDIALLAGGGTNNPFRSYSAYCVAKIGLIKMCELLDDEAQDINIFIIGPGFVKTKTHDETLRAGARAEENLARVREFLATGGEGTTFQEIYQCLRWSQGVGRDVVGGRNLSVVHDEWGSDELLRELRADRDMYKLRRFRNH
jgi:NAD(P)-dependent dehydrogenase (short-subunit alcohol dehydrogenase family)